MNSGVILPNSGIRAPPAITLGCISFLAFCLLDLHSDLYKFVSGCLQSANPASLRAFIVYAILFQTCVEQLNSPKLLCFLHLLHGFDCSLQEGLN